MAETFGIAGRLDGQRVLLTGATGFVEGPCCTCS